MTRDFIQETVDVLKKATITIEDNWKKFQSGEIDKETFESEYKNIINDWIIDSIEDEGECPNNGCKYSDTKPECENFNKLGI